jgi:hypothetical protein
MYGLAVGIQNLGKTLPGPVYALLSGLNAATVGIVAVSAVQLAEKAIHDKISRILIIVGACAGLCYNALWYFPVLMVIGGIAIALWDGWMSSQVQRAKRAWRNRHHRPAEPEEANSSNLEMQSPSAAPAEQNDRVRSRKANQAGNSLQTPGAAPESTRSTETEASQLPVYQYRVSIRTGLVIMVAFFGMSFAIISLS